MDSKTGVNDLLAISFSVMVCSFAWRVSRKDAKPQRKLPIATSLSPGSQMEIAPSQREATASFLSGFADRSPLTLTTFTDKARAVLTRFGE